MGHAKVGCEKRWKIHYTWLCSLEEHEIYAQRGPKSILAQVNRPTCEGNWILLQMKYIM